jgi:hypothetical protein
VLLARLQELALAIVDSLADSPGLEFRVDRPAAVQGQRFCRGQNRYKLGITDHPGRTMINYAPLPRQVLHMWPTRGGQASDQRR